MNDYGFNVNDKHYKFLDNNISTIVFDDTDKEENICVFCKNNNKFRFIPTYIDRFELLCLLEHMICNCVCRKISLDNNK